MAYDAAKCLHGLIAAGAEGPYEGRRTLLLEKNRRPGVKILMSGGTKIYSWTRGATAWTLGTVPAPSFRLARKRASHQASTKPMTYMSPYQRTWMKPIEKMTGSMSG